MKRLLPLLALLITPWIARAQTIVTPVGTVFTVDASTCGNALAQSCAFSISPTATSSLVISNARGGQQLSLFFTDPGSFTVSWPANVTSPPIVNSSQLVVLQYNATVGSWAVATSSSGSTGVTLADPLKTIVASPTCATGQTRCIQLPATGGILWDCSWPNSSSTITCPDAVFTSSMVGMRMFGVYNPAPAGGGPEVTGSVVQVPVGTISTYISSTQVTVSTTTTNSCTYVALSSGCEFIWYNLADTQFATAWSQAAGSPDCVSLQTAAGVWGISTANFNSATSACKLGVGIARTGPAFVGQGMDSTILVLDPSFSFASCTNGTSGVGCLFTSGGIQLQNFQLFGGCNPVGGTHAVNLVELDSGIANTTTLVNNVSFSCFGGTTTNLVGVQVYNNTPQPVQGLWIQDFGTINFEETASTASTGMEVANFFVSDCAVYCVDLTSSNTFLVETNAVLGPSVNANSNVVFIQGGQFVDYSGSIAYGSTNQATASDGIAISGGFAKLFGTSVKMPTANNQQAIGLFGTSASVYCSACSLTGGGTTFGSALAFNSSATNHFWDLGGNTYGGVYVFISSTGNNFNPFKSLSGACTGTASSSTTLYPYQPGAANQTTTCTNTTAPVGAVMDHPGTLQVLQVTASHAGVSASSGVVTVYKNGSATALTCTIGTAVTCQDPLISHSVSFNPGDLIYVGFTTQATEVLAGVQAAVSIN